MRANCKFGAGFSDKVFVLCAVNQDGSFSRIAADDLAKYGPAVSALACEKVRALNLKSPGKDPVPLVISLSNKPELNIVYVSGINYDTYIAYRGSGVPAADKAALDAVQRSEPLKPLPDGSCEDLYLAFSLDYY